MMGMLMLLYQMSDYKISLLWLLLLLLLLLKGGFPRRFNWPGFRIL
jgi:hypothetical protein